MEKGSSNAMAKKTLLFILVFLIVFTLSLNNIFLIPVSAGSTDLLSRENMINLAKGIAALYLLNRINSLVIDQQNNVQGIEERQTKVDYTGLPLLEGKIIVIDPGHGGSDPGAVGSGGLREKDINLDIALKLYNILKANTKSRVYLTRDDDSFVSLNERSAMANKFGADVFISIHMNGDEKRTESGIETYAHYSAPQKTWALAWYLHESLVKELKLADRGLKADNFHVVRETNNMKSLLLEIGFITNHTEEALLRNNKIRERAARAVYNGLLTYFSTLSS